MVVFDADGNTVPTYRFTPEDGRKGNVAQKAVLEKRKTELRRRHDWADRIVTELDDIAPEGFAAVLALLEKASGGIENVPLETSLDLVRITTAAETLHRIARLASGQSTANVAHATLSEEERAARKAELLARLGVSTLPPDAT